MKKVVMFLILTGCAYETQVEIKQGEEITTTECNILSVIKNKYRVFECRFNDTVCYVTLNGKSLSCVKSMGK